MLSVTELQHLLDDMQLSLSCNACNHLIDCNNCPDADAAIEAQDTLRVDLFEYLPGLLEVARRASEACVEYEANQTMHEQPSVSTAMAQLAVALSKVEE